MRKNKDFFKNRRSTIFFLGTMHGTGLTTFAISYAAFLSCYERKNVCLVEMNENREIITMDSEETVVSEECIGYSYKGIDFYPDSKDTDLSSIRKAPYDYIIVDLGVRDLDSMPRNEWDRLFIIGSLRPWKKSKYYAFAKELADNHDIPQGEYFASLLNKSEKKDFEKEFNILVRSLPLIKDPFKLSADDIGFFKEIKGR